MEITHQFTEEALILVNYVYWELDSLLGILYDMMSIIFSGFCRNIFMMWHYI